MSHLRKAGTNGKVKANEQTTVNQRQAPNQPIEKINNCLHKSDSLKYVMATTFLIVALIRDTTDNLQAHCKVIFTKIKTYFFMFLRITKLCANYLDFC